MAKKQAPKKSSGKKPAPKSKPVAKKPAAKNKAEPKAKASAAKPAPAAKPSPVVRSPEIKRAFPAPVAIKASGITPLTVSAQGSGGNAAAGNTHPANILTVVSQAGVPVADNGSIIWPILRRQTMP